VGAEPAGVTDCLCFGNPDKPDRFWQFRKAIEGIVTACTAFRLPVVSGNVSFYNETADSVIHPSPLIGMVGVLDNVENHTGMALQDDGDVIVMIGRCDNELGGSEYLAMWHGKEMGMPPQLNMQLELNVQRLTLAAIRRGIIKSAHDLSDGGLAVALAEMCVAGKKGATVVLPTEIAPGGARLDSILFGEAQSRILLTVKKDNLNALVDMARQVKVPLFRLGTVGGEQLSIAQRTLSGVQPPVIHINLNELEWAYRGAIARIMSE
jgi:phosphoribosylformylglycinamidine synthase